MPTRHRPILATLLLVLAAGCDGITPVEGSGKTATEDRKVEGFQRVHAQSTVEVVVEVTGTESATVEADDNLLPLVQTTVENGTLRVGVKGSLNTRNPIRVRVTAKQLEGLTAESSAKVSSKVLKTDRLALSASSSGQVTANNVEAKQLKVSVSSAGGVTATGRADQQEIDASSSGHYDGSKLVSRTSQVTCSAAASTELHATQEVSGSVSSAGSVLYSGNPAKVAVSASSAGSVQAAGK